jgi:hypothetical protein
MRFILHFNPQATQLLGTDQSTIEFAKLAKPLQNGATTKVRISDSGKHAFTPRDSYGNRYGACISKAVAKEAGLKGRQRYTLHESGKSGWFNLVPHSAIGKKVRRIDGAGLSVSIIEKPIKVSRSDSHGDSALA